MICKLFIVDEKKPLFIDVRVFHEYLLTWEDVETLYMFVT